MAVPSPTHPAHLVSEADLATALQQIGAEIDHQPLRSSVLARIMRACFGGSDASGAWDWRMAYDMMQSAAIRQLLHRDDAEDGIAAARLLASRLLTETRRSEQQIRLQQFSTPLPYAALVARAAAMRPSHARSPVRRSPRRSKARFASMPSMRRNESQTNAARPTNLPDPMPKTTTLSFQTQKNPPSPNRYQQQMPTLSP
jgi:hypothetical protein